MPFMNRTDVNDAVEKAENSALEALQIIRECDVNKVPTYVFSASEWKHLPFTMEEMNKTFHSCRSELQDGRWSWIATKPHSAWNVSAIEEHYRHVLSLWNGTSAEINATEASTNYYIYRVGLECRKHVFSKDKMYSSMMRFSTGVSNVYTDGLHSLSGKSGHVHVNLQAALDKLKSLVASAKGAEVKRKEQENTLQHSLSKVSEVLCAKEKGVNVTLRDAKRYEKRAKEAGENIQESHKNVSAAHKRLVEISGKFEHFLPFLSDLWKTTKNIATERVGYATERLTEANNSIALNEKHVSVARELLKVAEGNLSATRSLLFNNRKNFDAILLNKSRYAVIGQSGSCTEGNEKFSVTVSEDVGEVLDRLSSVFNNTKAITFDNETWRTDVEKKLSEVDANGKKTQESLRAAEGFETEASGKIDEVGQLVSDALAKKLCAEREALGDLGRTFAAIEEKRRNLVRAGSSEKRRIDVAMLRFRQASDAASYLEGRHPTAEEHAPHPSEARRELATKAKNMKADVKSALADTVSAGRRVADVFQAILNTDTRGVRGTGTETCLPSTDGVEQYLLTLNKTSASELHELLNSSRLDSKKQQLEKQTVDLAAVVASLGVAANEAESAADNAEKRFEKLSKDAGCVDLYHQLLSAFKPGA
ncbi:hypothetical protein ERJ75_001205400 [Trypanosoma vivax]|nr:hypothetical protein ERJ75_001205400 [Trypanosoma vivax]